MTTPQKVEYVVIGAGIHGLSTAWHLAKKLKALGNSVVPNVIHRIGLAIKESFNEM